MVTHSAAINHAPKPQTARAPAPAPSSVAVIHGLVEIDLTAGMRFRVRGILGRSWDLVSIGLQVP